MCKQTTEKLQKNRKEKEKKRKGKGLGWPSPTDPGQLFLLGPLGLQLLTSPPPLPSPPLLPCRRLLSFDVA